MKYHIKDIFGNYTTYDSPTYFTFWGFIVEMIKILIIGVGSAILIMLLLYLLILFLGFMSRI